MKVQISMKPNTKTGIENCISEYNSHPRVDVMLRISFGKYFKTNLAIQ